MNQEPATRKNEMPVPRPEPAGDPDPPAERREMKLDADDRTPEEAGYGYGV